MTAPPTMENFSSNSSYFTDTTCSIIVHSLDPRLTAVYYVDYKRRIVTIGIPIVVILGLLGNLSFLFVICRLKHMRNMTNIYLANLAVADVVVLLAASVQYFGSYAYSAPLDVSQIGFTFETPVGCSLPSILNYSCYFASIWFITLVATERFLAICHPFRHRMIRGKGRAFRLILGAWLISFLMGSFAAPYAGIEIICIDGPSNGILGDMPLKISRCTALCKWCNVVLWVIDTLQFFAALLANTLMYGFIIHILSLRTIASEQNGSLSQETTRIRNQENRDNVARMLSVNAVVFFFCLSPYMILNLNSLFGNFLNINFESILEWVSKMVYLLNSASNPYIYSGINRRYRQAFLKAFQFSVNVEKRNQRNSSFVTGTISMKSTRIPLFTRETPL